MDHESKISKLGLFIMNEGMMDAFRVEQQQEHKDAAKIRAMKEYDGGLIEEEVERTAIKAFLNTWKKPSCGCRRAEKHT